MKHLDPARFRAALACSPGGRLEELVREYGMPFHPVPRLVAPISPIDDMRALVELKSLYRELRPAIVHTHNSKAGFLGRLAARLLPEKERPSVVHTVHGFAFHDRESPLRRSLFRQLERMAFPWADATIAISPELARWGARAGIGRESDYTIAWSGIEVERFANANRAAGRRALDLPDDAIAVGLVSKLWEGKGHDFLLDVMEPLLSPLVRLVFIGEGPIEAKLRARVAKMPADKQAAVHFAGFHPDTADVTAALDIATLPSLFEGMGRVLLEAQAAGVPVIANRIGGTVDVVKDGGVLVAPGDATAWRDALNPFIVDLGLRRRTGDAGKRFVSETFSAERMVRTLETVYDRVLKNRCAQHPGMLN
jgi:glycosyltransferase involved in cell wall biosynthesis